MIEAGADLVTNSKPLGHASTQIIMKYAHPTQEGLKRATNKLCEVFQESLHQ